MIARCPVSRRLQLVLLLVCSACIAAPAHAADEALQELTLRLKQITAQDVATALVTVAGTKKFTAVDERTIVVQDTAEKLALAEAVAKMADTSDAPAAKGSFAASDGTVITCVTLENVLAVDVLEALYKQVEIARIATLGEKKIFLRDTDKQTTAALKVINDLDSPASH